MDDPATENRAQVVVIFDNDGTLADSLPPHIEFLHRMNNTRKLGLVLPLVSDLDACRAIAAAPMDAFIRKAGFPEAMVGELDEAYQTTFAVHHPVSPFNGVAAMLGRLRRAGIRMAVVSSNTSVNVRAALGPVLCTHFETILGIDNAELSKSLSIRTALRVMGVHPASSQVTYVGDTQKDALCALDAGCTFVGVDYGFEDMSNIPHNVAKTVEQLEHILTREQ